MLLLQDVCYTYQSKYQLVHALKGVSCRFAAGKFHVIEGRSGSGKSTLLSLLAGLDAPSGGTITLDGTPYSEIDGDRLRQEHVSVIFQSFNLFPLLTARENVMVPMELRRDSAEAAREKAEALILSVGLGSEVFGKYPAMLSGGEQQRVAIARALASTAKIILADEPTGNLDSETGGLIISTLRSLVEKEGYCVILVTHDRGIAQTADVLYRMADGEMVCEEGEPA